MHLTCDFGNDDGDDDDQGDGDGDGGDGQQLPESNLQTWCRAGVDQVETRQGVGPGWTHPLPILYLVCTRSTNWISTAVADHHLSPSPSP